ncbi:hypothetical protein BDZ94DRAFT_1262816 [Collybia nuda]|uniref:Uncharacterized protein n=1 Tax=Collybia nuda TaxID=64659 RepID=A0A9P6CIG3_9AGAR|nr:hypothetical protein BDZ94DRAFT_1262816 [Collybia nuda]
MWECEQPSIALPRFNVYHCVVWPIPITIIRLTACHYVVFERFNRLASPGLQFMVTSHRIAAILFVLHYQIRICVTGNIVIRLSKRPFSCRPAPLVMCSLHFQQFPSRFLTP